MGIKDWLEIRTATPERFEHRIVEVLARKHPSDHVAYVIKPYNADYDDEGWSHMDCVVNEYYNNRHDFASWADIADAMWEQYQTGRRRVVYA